MKRSKPGKTFDNPASEKQFRNALMVRAKALGCERDLQQILNKFDEALKKCKNDTEIRHIQVVGAAEIHKLFGCRGGLTVNGWTIIPAEPEYEDARVPVNGGSKIVKI